MVTIWEEAKGLNHLPYSFTFALISYLLFTEPSRSQRARDSSCCSPYKTALWDMRQRRVKSGLIGHTDNIMGWIIYMEMHGMQHGLNNYSFTFILWSSCVIFASSVLLPSFSGKNTFPLVNTLTPG